MRKLSFKQIQKELPSFPVQIWQRFGFDRDGRKLTIDGKVGPKTEGATYFLPKKEDAALVLVSFALTELLMGAQEYPVGRNSGKDVAKYYLKPDEVEENHGAWCAAFTGWCLRQAFGEDAPYSWSARRLRRRCEVWGEKVSLDQAEAGFVIGWSRDSAGPHNGHVGIIIGEDEEYVYTIEGNSGPFVRVFRYAKSNDLKRGPDEVLGIARPPA